jgi:hypothetical protein
VAITVLPAALRDPERFARRNQPEFETLPGYLD